MFYISSFTFPKMSHYGIIGYTIFSFLLLMFIYMYLRVIWNSGTLATSCEELTHWKRLWRWEGLGAGGEGDDRRWDGWMASPTQWTWVWVNSGRWWWTGRPGVLRFTGSQRVGHDWATELNWCLWVTWWLLLFLSLNSFHSMDGCITLWLSIHLLNDTLETPFLPCPLSLDTTFSVYFFESCFLLTMSFI